jgi:glycine oxidase
LENAPQKRSYDAVVVGAGAIGLACAWRLAQRGLSVLVLDRDGPGAGASGVAAGMLAPVTEAEFGEEELLRLNLEGAGLWPAFAAELSERSGLDTGYRDSGAVVVGVDRDDREELRRLHSFQRSLGLEAEWLPGRECRRLEPALSPRVNGGIAAPQDAQVDPRAVVRALVAALEREGGAVAGGAEVAAIETAGGRPSTVRIAPRDAAAEAAHPGPDAVEAGVVVVATGCWTGELVGDLPIRPVKGQILRLRRPAGSTLATRVVRTPRCYVVDRSGGEVVVGATVEERGFDTSVTADGVQRLLEHAREALPDVGELELIETAAGLRPGTPDNAPLVGEHRGLVLATGHYRNGVLLAPVTAEAVARLVVDGDVPEAVEPFQPERLVQPASEGVRS